MTRTALWVLARIAFGISWVAAGLGAVPGWERSVTRGAVDLPGWTTPLLRTVMQAGTRLTPFVVAVVLAIVWGWRLEAVAVLAGGLAAWVFAEVTKDGFDRPRPTVAALGRPIRDVVHGPGYPSSHTAVATALCVTIGLLLERRHPVVVAALVAVPVLTAVGRMHVGAHWFLDVVGGAWLGATFGLLAAAFVRHDG